MLEVFGGKYKGKKLNVPEEGTVPTKNRVREALFDILGHNLKGLIFLDLFAGSGAVGIEALSQGADAAYFVDKAKEATKIIAANLKGIEGGHVLNLDFREALEQFEKEGTKFDIVFLDPPYKSAWLYHVAVSFLKEKGLLNPGYRIVIEGEGDPSLVEDLKPFRVYHYGRTYLALIKDEE